MASVPVGAVLSDECMHALALQMKLHLWHQDSGCREGMLSAAHDAATLAGCRLMDQWLHATVVIASLDVLPL